MNRDHYESTRDQEFRVPKTTIPQFSIEDNILELFISYYHEDTYSIRQVEENRALGVDFGIQLDKAEVSMPDLYTLTIDEITVSGLRWFRTTNKQTNQEGLITSIPLDSLAKGYHELTIDKV